MFDVHLSTSPSKIKNPKSKIIPSPFPFPATTALRDRGEFSGSNPTIYQALSCRATSTTSQSVPFPLAVLRLVAGYLRPDQIHRFGRVQRTDWRVDGLPGPEPAGSETLPELPRPLSTPPRRQGHHPARSCRHLPLRHLRHRDEKLQRLDLRF